jgi:hypothetical protein
MNRSELLNYLPKNSIGAELGVYLGEFSQEILNQVQPKKLYLIDVWDFIELSYRDKLMRNHKSQYANYRTVLKKFYNAPEVFMIREKTNIISEIFPNGYFDWVYIDADHSYEGCLHDLINCDPLVKADGMILGHDYDENSFPGVIQAVQEFVNTRGYFLTYITNENACPSYVISKTESVDSSFKKIINPNIS